MQVGSRCFKDGAADAAVISRSSAAAATCSEGDGGDMSDEPAAAVSVLCVVSIWPAFELADPIMLGCGCGRFALWGFEAINSSPPAAHAHAPGSLGCWDCQITQGAN